MTQKQQRPNDLIARIEFDVIYIGHSLHEYKIKINHTLERTYQPTLKTCPSPCVSPEGKIR